MRGHDVQLVARVAQHLGNAPAVKGLQVVAKLVAHLLRAHALLALGQLVVLVDVVVLQPLKGGHRLVQAGRGHAPGANGRAHQRHVLAALRQPLAKDKTVQRPQYQTLGATGGGRNHAHVRGLQAVRLHMGAGAGPGVDIERAHGLALPLFAQTL